MLALAAARLGHAPVLACDDDPDAVEVARENAARNDCEIQVWQCDALYDELPKAVGLWLANLQLAPLEELAWRPDLPPRLIVSGLLEGEAFQPPGYRIARAPQPGRLGGTAARARGRGVSFSVEFLGCKISHTDVQGVRERLLAGGLEEASEGGAVHVVNTCCVTNEAVAKSRKAVRAALRRGAEQVYVTGCATRLGAGDVRGRRRTGHGRARDNAEEAAERIARELGATACVGPAPRLERTRAFVKVQDGCTFGCSFCVIPRVRGASRSRPLRAVLDEARRRIAQGHRELVVTGVNLGLYRDAEAGRALPDVLGALAELDGVARVRLSSIEVNHLSARLCEALAHPRVCPHLHVPLQSGDDARAAAMRRRYDLATYAAPRRARPRARARPQPHGRRDRGLPGRGRRGLRAHARGGRGARVLAPARVPVLAAAGHAHGGCRSGARGGQAPPRRAPARALRPARAGASRTRAWGSATAC